MEKCDDCSCDWVMLDWYSLSANGQRLESPIFPDAPSSKFKFKIVWRCEDEDDPSSCSPVLILVSAPQCKVWAKCSVTFRSQNEKVLFRVKDFVKFNNCDKLGKVNFEHVIAENLRYILHTCFDCNYFLQSSITLTAIVSKPCPEIKKTVDFHKCEVIRDLRIALDDPESFSDVVICVGDIKLKASRFLLAARSSVFRAAFNNNTLEKSSGRIEISGFEPDSIRLLLRFIYQGYVDISDFSVAAELLKAADIYDIEGLKELCESYIAANLNQDNFADVLLLAEMNQAPSLKEYAMSYFIANPKCYQISKFSQIEKHRPNLLSELLVKVTEKSAIDDILLHSL